MPVPFVTVDRGTNSGVRSPLNAVVRSGDNWVTLWDRHAGRSVAPPAVDFSAEMILAVFTGERPTSGYAVEVTEVRSTDRGLEVLYRELVPSALVRPVLTAPFHIIRLRRDEMPVHFSHTRTP